MSSRDWLFRVNDILEAIEKIERYLKKTSLSEFKKNDLISDAIIRNFEIIGEASKNVPVAIRKKYSNIPWSQMNGMRNVLIHEYFGVDLETVWHTAKHHLPPLREQLVLLIKEKKKKS